ncbi:hypothetical protein GKO32_21685 [Amycolatopsis sp. RM579]|uniref:DUF2946 domain-containing protein n=1 Tax=Amycolatopsis pithecellobii TaxID=664692 RepID=A0A6N7Z3M6_9PSEU|nr:hypothetical protein [Amycolatopsis pithecellobii]
MLLAVLALGLIAMHHAPAEHGSADGAAMSVVAMTAEPSPTLSAAPMTDDHGMGAMLHQCLAVLGQLTFGALLVLLLVLGFARLTTRHRVPSPRARARAPDRPAGSGGRSLLTSVCVLRL